MTANPNNRGTPEGCNKDWEIWRIGDLFGPPTGAWKLEFKDGRIRVIMILVDTINICQDFIGQHP